MKKIIILFLTALLTIQPLAYAADAEGEVVAVKNNFNYSNLKILIALDIIPASVESGDFNVNKEVTRGELAYYIIRFLGLDDISDSGGSVFSDIDQHQYAAYINEAAKLGLISGYENGTFEPDSPVLYEQSIKVLVSALGYDFYAVHSGGYPAGYLAQADNILLTKKVGASYGTPLTQGALTQLLYNALDIDMAVRVGFGDDATYNIEKGNTVLTERKDMGKVKGIVTGNEITSLSGNPKVSEGKVMISDEPYIAGVTNAADLLGYYVAAYYKTDKNTDEKTLLYISAAENKNEELKVKADDIISYDNHKYTFYNENGNTDTAEITAKTDVIYNGKSLTINYNPSNYDKRNFKPLVGEIKLLDTNGDGGYDVLFITAYTTTVVDSVDADDEKILAKEDITRNIDLSKNVKYIIYDNTGTAVSLEEIAEYNVLSVAKSIDSRYFNILVSTEQTSGTITEKTVESDKIDKILIDGIEYNISKDFVGKASYLDIDNNGEFYIDALGNIAYFKYLKQGDLQYGYLKGIHIDSKGVDRRLQMKILSIGSGFINVKTAKSVLINGSETAEKNPDAIAGLFKDVSGNFVLQPVKYSLNQDGDVNRIYSVGNGIKLLRGNYEKYWSNGSTFECKVPISEDTVVISAPGSKSADSEDNEFTVKKKNSLINGNKYQYEAYNTDENSDIADLVILYSSSTSAPADQGIALVDKISKAINENGEEVQKIKMLFMGSEVEKYGTSSTTFDSAAAEANPSVKCKLQQGDVIRFTTDADGNIIAPILIYQKSTSTFYGNFTGGMDTQHRTIYGSVYEKTTDYIKICRDTFTINENTDIKTANVEYYPYKRYSIYVYDPALNNKVYLGTESDIKDYLHSSGEYSRILVQTKNGSPDSLVVYK